LAPFKRPPLPLEFPPAPARLDLSSAESQQFLGYGWSGAEKGFRWTDGDEAAFIFAVADPADTLLTISVTPFLVPGRLHVQRVELILNGHSLTRLELSGDGPAVYEVNLPRSVLSQKNVLVFRLPDAASPGQFKINADERRLALAVHWISFSRSIQGSPPPAKP
jgi:hypothetical protein